MPGIFGYYLLDHEQMSFNNRLIDTIAEKLKHFSFYEKSTIKKDNAGAGIVDFEKNHPKIHEDRKTGAVVAVFGDIFAFNGIGTEMESGNGKSIPEFILDLYFKYGNQLPEKINGDFNIFVLEPGKKKAILFNDRFGYRHLYYYLDSNIFIFSPEIKAFSCYERFNKQIDRSGMADYLNYFYQLGDRTMFSDVKLLPPGSSIRIDGNSTEMRRYWQPKYALTRGTGEIEESVEAGFDLFVQSVNRRVKGRKNLLVPLSGGLDSRLSIVVARDLGCDITAATFGSGNCLDYRIAKKVIRKLGIQNHRFVNIRPDWFHRFGAESLYLNDSNYGFLGPAALYGFFEEVGNQFDGLLNGIFGGHLSFGSPYYRNSNVISERPEQDILKDLVKGLDGNRYERFLRDAATPETNDFIQEYRFRNVKEEWDRTRESSNLDALRQDNFFLNNRIRRGMNNLDLNRFFYNSLLPFSSYELYDFYLTLKPELTLNHFLYKSIYKNKFPHLAEIPWQSTGVNLYKEKSKYVESLRKVRRDISWYVTRCTKGRINVDNPDTYIHEDNYYRRNSDLRKWVEKLLLSDRFLDRGYFRKRGVEMLLKYQAEGGSVFPEIGKLVGLELWFQNNMDGKRE